MLTAKGSVRCVCGARRHRVWLMVLTAWWLAGWLAGPRAAHGGQAGTPPSRPQALAQLWDAIEPLAPGQVARYDDEFEVRAFGDNLTKWGTSVVLIETGAPAADPPDPAAVRLNFVAIVTALQALASGSVNAADPARYESLPKNESGVFYKLIRNASIVAGTGVAPFTGDLGLVASRSIQETGGQREIRQTLRIDDLGDLRVFGALEIIDAEGLTVTPLFDEALKAGDETALPDWTTRQKGAKVAPGELADLVLLRPLAQPGAFRVERVIRATAVVSR